MREEIKNLFECVRDDTAAYLIYQDRTIIEKTKKNMPQIQKFVLWFLEDNGFGIEDELYRDMCRNLLNILQDIACAMEQCDIVLMNDALAYGLIEYLKLFLEPEEGGDTI